jgi:hypothetical protein
MRHVLLTLLVALGYPIRYGGWTTEPRRHEREDR